MNDDTIWAQYGITGEAIAEKASWLKEKRNLHGRSRVFFDQAGRILAHARFDYLLISSVFFHAILGLESALKLHYKKEKEGLKLLLQRAIVDGLITDSVFSNIQPLSKEIISRNRQLSKLKTHHEKLTELIPYWRNQYFHGDFLLWPDYFHLTIQLREIADVLTTIEVRA